MSHSAVCAFSPASMPENVAALMAESGFCCLAWRFADSPDMPLSMEDSWSVDETSALISLTISLISSVSFGFSPSRARKDSEPWTLRKASDVSCPAFARER